jgi:hypothetical protein
MLSGTTFRFGHFNCFAETFVAVFFAAVVFFRVEAVFFFVAMQTLLGWNETRGPCVSDPLYDNPPDAVRAGKVILHRSISHRPRIARVRIAIRGVIPSEAA